MQSDLDDLHSAKGHQVTLGSHGLTFSQMTNFRLFQTYRVCGKQFQI